MNLRKYPSGNDYTGGVKCPLRGIEKNANTRLKVGCNNLLVILYNTFNRKYSPLFGDFALVISGRIYKTERIKVSQIIFC